MAGATNLYIGRSMTTLLQLSAPRPNMDRSPDRMDAAQQLLGGGYAVHHAPNAVRTWKMEWAYDDAVWWEMWNLYSWAYGPGPYVMLEPGITNYLSPNQSSGTDVLQDATGFSVGAQTAHVSDAFGRTSVDTWGSADSGQAYTLSGTAADFDVNGGVGKIQPTTLSADYFATVTADNGADRVVKTSFAWSALPATGELSAGVVPRFTDTSNWYLARVIINTAGAMTLELAKKVATVFTSLATVVLPTTYVGGTTYSLQVSISGSTLSAMVWLTSGVTPTAYQLTVTDTSLPTGTKAGCFASNTSAVTTHVASFDNLTMTGPSESLASSTAFSVRGRRSLKWTLPAAVTSGKLTFVPPQSLVAWATAVGMQWAFSLSVKAVGTDATVDTTCNLVWLDSSAAVLSTSTGSTRTTSGTFQQASVVATAPANAVGMQVDYRVTANTVTTPVDLYIDECQLQLSAAVGSWRLGESLPVVAFAARPQEVLNWSTTGGIGEKRGIAVALAQLGVN